MDCFRAEALAAVGTVIRIVITRGLFGPLLLSSIPNCTINKMNRLLANKLSNPGQVSLESRVMLSGSSGGQAQAVAVSEDIDLPGEEVTKAGGGASIKDGEGNTTTVTADASDNGYSGSASSEIQTVPGAAAEATGSSSGGAQESSVKFYRIGSDGIPVPVYEAQSSSGGGNASAQGDVSDGTNTAVFRSNAGADGTESVAGALTADSGASAVGVTSRGEDSSEDDATGNSLTRSAANAEDGSSDNDESISRAEFRAELDRFLYSLLQRSSAIATAK